MVKWIMLGISIFFLSNLVTAAPSLTERPTVIRVVMDDNYPPYVFKNEDGQLQGILVDQWQQWEKVTGTKAELHAMD